MTRFELETHETTDPGIVLVEVAGELDLTSAHDLEEQLGDLSRRSSTLVLDLNRVLFIDSAALHLLFRTARDLDGGRLGIVLEPTSPIARTLEIAGLPEVVPTRESLDALLAALPPSAT